jgi:hypothetical protein
LDEQIVFTRDYESYRFLVCWAGWPNSNDTWIIKDTLQQINLIYNSTIRTTKSYTWQDRVFQIPEKL